MAEGPPTVEMTRIERYGGKNLLIFVYCVRVLGATAGVCAVVLAIFGFISLVRSIGAQAPPVAFSLRVCAVGGQRCGSQSAQQ
jgi:uncharacterized membrane protein